MQEWFEAGACDGFSLAIDAYHDGVDTFVDQVVPLLQNRGLFHLDYEGPTLRDHLAAHDPSTDSTRASQNRPGNTRPHCPATTPPPPDTAAQQAFRDAMATVATLVAIIRRTGRFGLNILSTHQADLHGRTPAPCWRDDVALWIPALLNGRPSSGSDHVINGAMAFSPGGFDNAAIHWVLPK
jgi:hypothetical protein